MLLTMSAAGVKTRVAEFRVIIMTRDCHARENENKNTHNNKDKMVCVAMPAPFSGYWL